MAYYAKGALVQSFRIDNRIIMVTLLHQESGGGLASISRGSNYIRLTILDETTGSIVGKKVFSPHFEIRMVVNGIIWLSLNRARYQNRADQELIGYDILRNQKIFDQDILRKELGILTAEAFIEMKIDINTGLIHVLDAKGTYYTFDTHSLRSNGAKIQIVTPSEFESPISGLSLHHFRFIKIPNSEQFHLFNEQKHITSGMSFVKPMCLSILNIGKESETLIFYHQNDLNVQTKSYISAFKADDSNHSIIQELSPNLNATIEVNAFAESETNLYISVKNAKTESVIAVNKLSTKLEWLSTN